MTRISIALSLLATLAAPVWAQEPLDSFDALGTRLQVGDAVWVTDTNGRETFGRLQRLSSDAMTLDSPGYPTFSAADVRRIRRRDSDPLKNGALIGLGVGAGLAAAWCTGAIADDSGDIDARVECAEGLIFGGLGTLGGLVVDALKPGRLRDIYRRPQTGARGHVRLLLMPFLWSERRGATLVVMF